MAGLGTTTGLMLKMPLSFRTARSSGICNAAWMVTDELSYSITYHDSGIT